MNELPNDVLWLFLKHVLILHGPVNANRFSMTFKRLYGIYQSKEIERLETALSEFHPMRPVVWEFLAMKYCEHDVGWTKMELWIEDETHKQKVNGWCAHKCIKISPRKREHKESRIFAMSLYYAGLPKAVSTEDSLLFYEWLRQYGIRFKSIQAEKPEVSFGSLLGRFYGRTAAFCADEKHFYIEEKDLYQWFELSWKYDSALRDRDPRYGLYITAAGKASDKCWDDMPFIRSYASTGSTWNDRGCINHNRLYYHLVNMSRKEKADTIHQLKKHRGHITDLF